MSVSIFLEGMEASYRSERESGERSRYVSVNGSRLGRLDEHRFFHSSLIFIELKRAITRGNVVGWIIRVDTRSRAPRGTRILAHSAYNFLTLPDTFEFLSNTVTRGNIRIRAPSVTINTNKLAIL